MRIFIIFCILLVFGCATNQQSKFTVFENIENSEVISVMRLSEDSFTHPYTLFKIKDAGIICYIFLNGYSYYDKTTISCVVVPENSK